MSLWVDFEDAAASAAATLRAGRMDGDATPNMRVLCKRLPVGLELVPPFVLRGNHAARYSQLNEKIIRRRGMAPWDDQWWIGHELGHRFCRLAGRPIGELEELWCNAYAGALILPAHPLIERWRKGHDLRDLIEAFPHVRPTCLVLRVGELRLAETLVVQGAQLRYVRAEHEPEPELVRLGARAARCGQAALDHARAWKLPDMPHRAGVIVDAG